MSSSRLTAVFAARRSNECSEVCLGRALLQECHSFRSDVAQLTLIMGFVVRTEIFAALLPNSFEWQPCGLCGKTSLYICHWSKSQVQSLTSSVLDSSGCAAGRLRTTADGSARFVISHTRGSSFVNWAVANPSGPGRITGFVNVPCCKRRHTRIRQRQRQDVCSGS